MPLLLQQGTLLFSLIKFTPLKYNNTYQYPWWGHAIGIFIVLALVRPTPLIFLYSMAVTLGTVTQVGLCTDSTASVITETHC